MSDIELSRSWNSYRLLYCCGLSCW